MSDQAIRSALETAIASITPALSTAWENVKFTPVEGVPYQQVWLLGFIPDTPEITKSHRIKGCCQIDLMYPLLSGTKDIMARVALIKDKFKKASSFQHSGVTVNITDVPEVFSGLNTGDRWKVVVRIDYSAWIIVN